MGDLGATYNDHLRLIGKRVVDFLLVLIERFSLGVTAVGGVDATVYHVLWCLVLQISVDRCTQLVQHALWNMKHGVSGTDVTFLCFWRRLQTVLI